MNRNPRFSLFIPAILAFLGLLLLVTFPAAAQTNPTAQALFDAVNQLRFEENLPAYVANPILMEVAQNHSRYQASLGTWTHIGSGGTTVLQRAQSAGYGIGKKVTCSENVTFGFQMSAKRALEIWSAGEDLNNLISTSYVDAGVGAYIIDNGNVFYTLMICAIEGEPVTPTQTPAGEFVWGVSTTTPEPNGAIYHVVQEGQALESLARAYGVSLSDLRALNNLQPNEGIFIGDVLLIRPAHTPTPTMEIPPSPTPVTLEATATLRPTRTPFTPQPTIQQATRTPLPTLTPRPFAWVGSPQVGNGLLAIVFTCAAAGLLLIAYGFYLRRK